MDKVIKHYDNDQEWYVLSGKFSADDVFTPLYIKEPLNKSEHASCLHKCSAYVPKSLDHAPACPAEFCAICRNF